MFLSLTTIHYIIINDVNTSNMVIILAQHSPLSREAKTLSLPAILKMTDAEIEMSFRMVRWPATDGAPICQSCGGLDAYDCRRPKGAPRFRCRACRKDFSIASGTLFASHKMPLRSHLFAIAIFANEVKGKSALALSRDLGTSYKTCFVLAHKLREAMAEEMKGRVIGGEEDCRSRWRVFWRLRKASGVCAINTAKARLHRAHPFV